MYITSLLECMELIGMTKVRILVHFVQRRV